MKAAVLLVIILATVSLNVACKKKEKRVYSLELNFRVKQLELKCFSCTTTYIMMGCNDTVISPASKPCSEIPGYMPVCTRTTGKIQLPQGGSPAIARECVFYPKDDPSVHFGCTMKTMAGWDGQVEYCQCNTDDCNGHGTISPSSQIQPAQFIMITLMGLSAAGSYIYSMI